MKEPSTQYSGILNQSRLRFRDNADLEAYYENKYQQGGYEAGCVRFGINISAWYHEERKRSALRFLDPQPHEEILDAGCGSGELSAQIARRCRTVHAVDIAGNALNPGHRSIANLRFDKMNVENLAFADETFDKIASVETLEHVLEPTKALAEIFRVLKRRGCFVLTYPTINRTLVQNVQQRLRLTRPLAISEHLTEWSYDELVKNAALTGFAFSQSEGIVFDFGVLGALKHVSRLFAQNITALSLKIRSFPRNSTFVSVVFRKP